MGSVVGLPPLPEGQRLMDFAGVIQTIHQHEKQSRHRYRKLAAGILALLLSVAGTYWVIPKLSVHFISQSFDPGMVAERLHSDIENRFERDAEAARNAGKNWEAIRELEKNRDLALARIDEVVAAVNSGLADNPGPIFKEASRILAEEGSDAAIGYLDSHYTDILAQADRSSRLAAAAQDRQRQDLQPLLLKAELHNTRQEWDAALALLQTVAAKAPGWWEARRQLGNALNDLARHAEAEAHLRGAVALAADEKDWAVAANDLAQLLQATNRLAEAEPLMRRALAIDERSFGAEHPSVAIGLNNLGQLLQATNRLAEAEPLMRRALGIDERSFGAEHPKVAIRLNNLAQLLLVTNRLADAEPLMRRALLILLKFTHSVGHEHPHLRTFLGNYKGLLQKQQPSLAQINARLSEVGAEAGYSSTQWRQLNP